MKEINNLFKDWRCDIKDPEQILLHTPQLSAIQIRPGIILARANFYEPLEYYETTAKLMARYIQLMLAAEA